MYVVLWCLLKIIFHKCISKSVWRDVLQYDSFQKQWRNVTITRLFIKLRERYANVSVCTTSVYFDIRAARFRFWNIDSTSIDGETIVTGSGLEGKKKPNFQQRGRRVTRLQMRNRGRDGHYECPKNPAAMIFKHLNVAPKTGFSTRLSGSDYTSCGARVFYSVVVVVV